MAIVRKSRRAEIQDVAWLRKANDILIETVALDVGERQSFLDDACANDVALRQLLDTLLAPSVAALERLDGFASALAVSHAPSSCDSARNATENNPSHSATDAHETSSEPGLVDPANALIDGHRLLRKLGEGGMGVVYLAERNDGAYQTRVAIKILKPIGVAGLVRRFDSERQILANLQHPGIAQLLFGGTTEDKRPYFAMQYVEGVRIDVFCENRKFGITQRLELFLKVCEAVQFAHQNLVVHRDIKPSNVLVTATGEPKLLDFGIAKLLHPEGWRTSTITASGAYPMTLSYASPEQVKGSQITVACDIYALGVLLYELLTGHRPHSFKTYLPGEIERVICQEEPLRPSLSVGRPEQVPANEAEQTPLGGRWTARQFATSAHARRLKGDLDQIILKALRKDPRYRYATVERYAEDVRRYLTGRPVQARQGTVPYRAGKFLKRRGKEIALTVSAVVLALIFMVSLLTERANTTRERDKYMLVSEFHESFFAQADPYDAVGKLSVLEFVERRAGMVGELQARPEVHATYLNTVGKLYRSLGYLDRALPAFEKALELRLRLHGHVHLDVAESQHELGALMEQMGNYEAAAQLLERALLTRERLGFDPSLVASILDDLGAVHWKLGHYEDADATLQRSLRIRQVDSGGDSSAVAATLVALGALHRTQGQYAAAESAYLQALEINERIHGAEHVKVAAVLHDLGGFYHEQGRYDEAIRQSQHALEIKEKALGVDHPSVAKTLNVLAVVYKAQGQYPEAEAIYRRTLKIFTASLGADHDEVGMVSNNLAALYRAQGKNEAALELYRHALPILEQRFGTTHERVAVLLNNMAGVYDDQGRVDEALALFARALAMLRKTLGPEHPIVGIALTNLGRLNYRRGEQDEAERLTEQALILLRKELPLQHWRIVYAESLLAAVRIHRKQYDGVEMILQENYSLLRQQRGSESRQAMDVRDWLIAYYEARDMFEEANRFRNR